MKRLSLSGALAAAALGLCGAAALAAEDILFENGDVRRADILEVREDGIQVKGRKGPAVVEAFIPAARLDAEWFYGVRDRAAGEDAKARLRLALWCVEKGLFSRAQVQVKRAAAIDPALVKSIQEGKLPEIRDGIAARVLESARKDLKENRVEVAQQKVELILTRWSDTPAGADAADFLVEVEGRVAEKERADREEARKKLAEEERKAEEARDRKLAPVEETLLKAKEYNMKGLAEDSQPKALELIGQALAMAEASLKKLDSIVADEKSDATLSARAAEMRAKLTAAMVKAYVHRAELYMWRDSLPQAEKELEKAAALDPGNATVESSQARLEEKKTEDDEQLWRRRGAGDSRFGGRRGGGGGGRR